MQLKPEHRQTISLVLATWILSGVLYLIPYHVFTGASTYVLVSVPLQLAFALALAVLLDRGVRGLSFYRSVYYLPSLIGGR